jgi:hypothetical protein
VQEIYSIPPAIRKNLDTLWVFGGMNSKQAFSVLLNQAFPDAAEKKDTIWENYKKMSIIVHVRQERDSCGDHLEIMKNINII